MIEGGESVVVVMLASVPCIAMVTRHPQPVLVFLTADAVQVDDTDQHHPVWAYVIGKLHLYRLVYWSAYCTKMLGNVLLTLADISY